MRDIKEYYDGWAFIKDGVEIAFYNKFTNYYTFNYTMISDEDLEWFRDILH